MTPEEEREYMSTPIKTRKVDEVKKSPTQSMEIKPLRKDVFTDKDITSLFIQLDRTHSGRVGINQLILALNKNEIKINHKMCYDYLKQFNVNTVDDQLTLEQFL